MIGAGGHAAVVIEVARAAGWTPVIALDPGAQNDVLGVAVRGGDDLLEEVLGEGEIDAGRWRSAAMGFASSSERD